MIRRSLFIVFFGALGLLALPRAASAGATLFFAPSSSSVAVGGTVNVTVYVNTGGDPINAAQGTVGFPTEILQATSVSKGGLFTLWPVEPSMSGGSISFAGGLPTPGYTGSSGAILTIAFRATAVGTATISLSGSSVLKNDGSGTNILSGTGSATVTVTAASTTPTPTTEPEEETAVLAAPVIYSDTHPDEEAWYDSRDVSFVWDKLDGAIEFSYAFDDQSDTIPDDTADGTENAASYPNTDEGVWYFHVKVRNDGGWSDTAHFRVRIDVTPPDITLLRMEGPSPTKDRQPKIHVIATDALSGVDHYVIVIDDTTLLTVTTDAVDPFTLPELSYGMHTLEVRAYDRAGNRATSTITIDIVRYDSESGFWIGSTFVLFLWIVWGLLVILLVLVLLVILLILCCRRRRKQENEKRSQVKKGKSKRTSKR